MPCAAVHLYPILIQHMMAYRLAAVQVGINEQIHLALVKLPRGVDDGDIVQQDLRKGRLQRAGQARHQQRSHRWRSGDSDHPLLVRATGDIQRAEESFHAAADVLMKMGGIGGGGDALSFADK